MSDTDGPANDRSRNEAVERLCEAFAQDSIEVDEFERRVELAHTAETTDELRRLLSDLPADLPARTDEPGSTSDSAGAPVPAPTRRPRVVEAVHVPESSLVMGAMGGAVRKGNWTPARRTTAIGIMGGVELDFREAALGPGVTEVKCFAFWGGVDLIVPPGVAVECDGIGIMGGFDQVHDVPLVTDPDAPVIRIRGLAIMGGVNVESRYEGESSRDARRRRKLERKDRRRLERGD